MEIIEPKKKCVYLDEKENQDPYCTKYKSRLNKNLDYCFDECIGYTIPKK